MSRTHLRQPTKTELQDKTRRLEREVDALQRWFWYTERGEQGNTLDVRMERHGEPDQLYRFTVFGMSAPHGGIVVMRDINEGHSQTPEYLDDLCARLDRDVSWELRGAARQMRQARERFNAAKDFQDASNK